MIDRHELFTVDECAQIAARVDELRPFWESTSRFGRTFVLGAASYIHAIGGAGPAYFDRARRLGPILRDRLGWMYARVTAALAATLGAPVALADGLAPPGFHIYLWDPTMHLLKCSVHLDLQHEAHAWARFGAPDLAHPLSFTIALKLPSRGAGLEVWDKTRADNVGRARGALRAELDAVPPRHHAYARGELVTHSGQFFHRIAPIVLEPGEVRLTLQGHAIRCGDTWQAYW